MPRYIDAELMFADIQRYLCASCSICCSPADVKNSACEVAECLRMIDNAPTADVQPVKHGYWEDYYVGDSLEGVICTACKKTCTYEFDYCPSCGARMDGDTDA